MAEEHPHQRTSKRGSRMLWFLLAAVLLLPLALLLYTVFGPNPPIVVSKATTHITTPLAADGLPDYAAVLLAEMRKGVIPENNAAGPFLEAMWPTGDEAFSPIDANLVGEEMGLGTPLPSEWRISDYWGDDVRLAALRLYRERMKPPESTAEPKTETHEYEGEFLGYDMNESAFWEASERDASHDYRIEDVLDLAMDRAWTADDLPFATAWLDANEVGLERFLEGLERPHWYLPEADLLRGGRGAATSLDMNYVSLARTASRYLLIRLNRSLGESRYEDAAREALGILRLANHLGQESLLVDHLVASAVRGIGLKAVTRLASHPGVPASLLRKVQAEYEALTQCAVLTPRTLHGERLFALDSILQAEQQGVDQSDLLSNATDEIAGLAARTSIDWNAVLVAANDQHDQLTAALQLPTRQGRQDAFTAIDAAMTVRVTAVNSRWLQPARFLTPGSRGALVADAYFSSGFFAYSSLLDVEDRNKTQHDLTRVLLAAAIYHGEKGEWPTILDDLTPDPLSKPPADIYSGNAYRCRPTEDGFLLYSLGPNGIDDGGSREVDDPFGSGERVYEGIEIDSMLDPTTNTLSAEEQAAYDLLDKIPPGADDIPLRVPLPVEPWPWEE